MNAMTNETTSNYAYDVIQVFPDQLVPSPAQPPDRTVASSSMTNLKRSIEKDRLQYPPLVTPLADGKYQVIDGHRRIAAMKQLGHTTIPVMPTFGRPERLFAVVSGNQAKMTASQWVTVYLMAGEDAVPSGPAKSCIKKLDEFMGRDFLQSLANRGLSPVLWNLCNRVLKYAELGDHKRRDILNWLASPSVSTREVSSWVSAGNKVEELRRAITENRSPKM